VVSSYAGEEEYDQTQADNPKRLEMPTSPKKPLLFAAYTCIIRSNDFTEHSEDGTGG
jgi:hypothetical protein